MFSFCSDPSQLDRFYWLSCYLTTGKHMGVYASFGTVLLLLAITAPTALAFGFFGASSARSNIAPLRWLGKGYIAVVRGVPDIAFFLFFIIALDQGIEYLRHKVKCSDWDAPIRQGNDFIVCDAAKMPSAIGKSNRPPSLGRSAGAKLTVIRFAGNSNRELMIALRTRSRDSLTVVSGKPTNVNRGMPLLMCTSTVTLGASTPTEARL